MMKRIVWCCLIAGMGGALLYGAQPDGVPAAALAAAIAQHDLVLAYQDQGQRIPPEEIRRGRELLEPLAAKDPVAKSYLGSLITLEASETSRTNPIKSLAQLREGLALINEALASKPDDITIRMVRLINSSEVSERSPVKQWNKVAEDIGWLHGVWIWLPKPVQAEVSLYEGIYNIKAGNIEKALDAFDLCLETDPGSPSAKRAAQYLARYGE